MKTKKRKTKQTFSKKQKLVTAAIGGFIILVMVGSLMQSYGEEKQGLQTYKGIEFTNTGNGWVGYTGGGKQVFLATSPSELKNISIQIPYISTLNLLDKIYISSDPRESVRTALYMFEKNIPLSPTKVGACTVDIQACVDLPLKNCTDTTDKIGVVVFKEDNKTAINLNNNCLTIQGKYLTKLVDKLYMEMI